MKEDSMKDNDLSKVRFG